MESHFIRLSNPTQRALQNAGITTPQQLAQHGEKEILKLHGIGPGQIPKLREILENHGLSFKSR